MRLKYRRREVHKIPQFLHFYRLCLRNSVHCFTYSKKVLFFLCIHFSVCLIHLFNYITFLFLFGVSVIVFCFQIIISILISSFLQLLEKALCTSISYKILIKLTGKIFLKRARSTYNPFYPRDFATLNHFNWFWHFLAQPKLDNNNERYPSSHMEAKTRL